MADEKQEEKNEPTINPAEFKALQDSIAALEDVNRQL